MSIKIKMIFILSIIILINMQLYAKKVDEDKAKQIAVNYFEHILDLKKINRLVIFEKIIENNFENILCYYTIIFL